MCLILKQTDTYHVSIAQQFLFAVLSISLFVKMSNVWCTDLFKKISQISVFCAFSQKVLDISHVSASCCTVVAQSFIVFWYCIHSEKTLLFCAQSAMKLRQRFAMAITAAHTSRHVLSPAVWCSLA